ncbi:MAG: hypothetical protein NTU79_01175, partial [Planctomycetota bacterium]|nr:hypothetical protein [Planctomycetota bacterium]
DPLELDELDESLEELDDDEIELGELLLDDDDELLLRLMDELLDDPLPEEGNEELLELSELLLEELGDDELLDEELIDETLDRLLDGLELDDDESELLLDDELMLDDDELLDELELLLELELELESPELLELELLPSQHRQPIVKYADVSSWKWQTICWLGRSA